MLGANLVIPVQICDKLLCGQAKVHIVLSKKCQNDLEGQGQWPFINTSLEYPRMYVANVGIPAQIYNELSCGQGKVYRRTDRRRQWQYPFGLKGLGQGCQILRYFLPLFCKELGIQIRMISVNFQQNKEIGLPVYIWLKKMHHLLQKFKVISGVYSVVPLWRGQFPLRYWRKTPHWSPVRVRYRVSFAGSVSDWYSASVPTNVCTIMLY